MFPLILIQILNYLLSDIGTENNSIFGEHATHALIQSYTPLFLFTDRC